MLDVIHDDVDLVHVATHHNFTHSHNIDVLSLCGSDNDTLIYLRLKLFYDQLTS